MTYKEQLQHPLWQKKRLEILERDSFSCKHCLDENNQLHIHHKEYKKGKKAWEYDDDNFISLCKHCHCLIEHIKDYNVRVILTSKVHRKDSNFWILNTILLSPEHGLTLFISKYTDNIGIELITYIEKDEFESLDNLFKCAEKLI